MAAVRKQDKAQPVDTDAGLTPAPGTEVPAPDVVQDNATGADASADRSYTVLIEHHDDAVGSSWLELGEVTAATRVEAWEKAKAKWSQLVPPPPDKPGEDGTVVKAKLVPTRNWASTIESLTEYVPPRQVARGL